MKWSFLEADGLFVCEEHNRRGLHSIQFWPDKKLWIVCGPVYIKYCIEECDAIDCLHINYYVFNGILNLPKHWIPV